MFGFIKSPRAVHRAEKFVISPFSSVLYRYSHKKGTGLSSGRGVSSSHAPRGMLLSMKLSWAIAHSFACGPLKA